jgi:hypothetical protein
MYSHKTENRCGYCEEKTITTADLIFFLKTNMMYEKLTVNIIKDEVKTQIQEKPEVR